MVGCPWELTVMWGPEGAVWWDVDRFWVVPVGVNGCRIWAELDFKILVGNKVNIIIIIIIIQVYYYNP